MLLMKFHMRLSRLRLVFHRFNIFIICTEIWFAIMGQKYEQKRPIVNAINIMIETNFIGLLWADCVYDVISIFVCLKQKPAKKKKT